MREQDRLYQKNKIADLILGLILVLYPLRHIWLGVELTDGAYSAGNYLQMGDMNPMWLFATYLANVCGSALTSLPGGHTLMGLNAYTALVISLTALATYLFLVRFTKMPRWIAFVGELVAISLCWCPTTILYNYMTYFFFGLGAIILYIALVRENRWLLALAGIALGLNVMVRFPNLAEMALILCVWYYGALMKKRPKDVLFDTLSCIAGYVAGIGFVLVWIMAKYGLTSYVSGIKALLNMPSDASDYSLFSMILAVLLDYKASSRWLVCLVLYIVLGTMIGMFLCRKEGQIKSGVLSVAAKVLFMLGLVYMFRIWYAIGVFNIKYYTYESMFQWNAVFLLFTIIFAGIVIFSGEYLRNSKLLAAMVLIVIGVTPLGSNNHLYPNLNNMFLIYPFTLYFFWDLMREYGPAISVQTSGKGRFVPLYPVKSVLCTFLTVCVLQSMLFGAVFTFRDGMNGEKRDTKIVNNAIMKGMVTNQELAESIESLTEAVSELDPEQKIILYGQIPATTYILDRQSALSTTWPDLRSYALTKMQEEMQTLEQVCTSDVQSLPIIILGAEAMKDVNLQETEDAKLQLISDFMDRFEYEKTFENSKFIIYLPTEEM